MILGAVLAGGAWLLASLAGLPIDPFLPLVVALGLRRSWPAWARIVMALALAPLAAAACGDVATDRAALYAVAVMGSVNLADWFSDSVLTRTGFAAAALGSVLGMRTLLAWTDAAPAPSETLVSVFATVTWVAVHAAVTLPWSRGDA